MKTTLEILREARELISVPERWTQGHYAKDLKGFYVGPTAPEAVCWCMLGAIWRVGAFDCGNEIAADALTKLSSVSGAAFKLSDFNDTHSHAEVLAAFDKAIEAEEQK